MADPTPFIPPTAPAPTQPSRKRKSKAKKSSSSNVVNIVGGGFTGVLVGILSALFGK